MNRSDFQDPGGRSALRRATRSNPRKRTKSDMIRFAAGDESFRAMMSERQQDE